MRLTSLGHLAAALALALPAAWLGSRHGDRLAGFIAGASASQRGDARIGRRISVYPLPRDRPISFSFSRPLALIKIIAQPALDSRAKASHYGYGFLLVLRDENGGELTRHQVHLDAPAPPRVFRSGMRERFFRDSDDAVAGQDEVLIASAPAAARMDIFRLHADPAVRSIDVRVYEQRPMSNEQALDVFRRLSPRERAELVEANAFPAEYLAENEMVHIARNLWKPVGPLGIAGRDYQLRVLYEAVRGEKVQTKR